MARQAAPMKKNRTRYTQAYKDEALALADRIGVTAAAKELGIHTSQLYQWRTKMQRQQSVSDRERTLAEENAHLKRQLAEKFEELEIAKKAAVYFAKSLKYCPQWPHNGFTSLDEARAWVRDFMRWYNTEHRHSRIRFVTPAERHRGQDHAILAWHKALHQQARTERPNAGLAAPATGNRQPATGNRLGL